MSKISPASRVPVSQPPEGLSPLAHVGRIRPVQGGGGRRRSPRRRRSTVSGSSARPSPVACPLGANSNTTEIEAATAREGGREGVGGQTGRRQGGGQRPPYPAWAGGGKPPSVHPGQHQARSFDSPHPRVDRAARKGLLPTDSVQEPALLSLKPAALFTVNQYSALRSLDRPPTGPGANGPPSKSSGDDAGRRPTAIPARTAAEGGEAWYTTARRRPGSLPFPRRVAQALRDSRLPGPQGGGGRLPGGSSPPHDSAMAH